MSTHLPPVFLSHGSPMTSVEPGPAGVFWQALSAAMQAVAQRPRAILAISAHSLTREPVLMAAARHSTVHDFSGFPEALYRLRYDAPGAPDLAPRVASLVQAAGLPVHVSPEGGLDHGIWVPLRFAWPDADVPVLPLAFPPDWSPTQLYALGQALAPLADEGVLVMGSGSITHNLRLVFGRSGMPPLGAPEIAESAAFRNWFASRSAAADTPALPAAVRAGLAQRQQALLDGKLLPFAAPLVDNAGHSRLDQGALDDAQIAGMDWLVQGVSGSLPTASAR